MWNVLLAASIILFIPLEAFTPFSYVTKKCHGRRRSIALGLTEDLSELTKESFYCLRTPFPITSSTCFIECKRTDGKPLAEGRRTFAFHPGPLTICVREVPFSYGKLGGSIWQSSVAMAQHLASNPDLLRDKRVLELGAGVGLPGIVASKCGADRVVLSEFGHEGEVDGEIVRSEDERLLPSALLDNLGYNARLNACPEDRVSVRHLDWYDYHDAPLPREEEEYDLIIGSDLVNWEDDVAPLVSTLKFFLSNPQCSPESQKQALIMLSAENRQALPHFLQVVREEFRIVDIVNQTLIHFDDHPLLLIRLEM